MRRQRMDVHRAESFVLAEAWDLDFWQRCTPEERLSALVEFGSPEMLSIDDPNEVLQLGAAPNRIDLLREVDALSFAEAWPRRIESHYGRSPANWIDLDSLLAIKSAIDHPRHQEDARILKLVRDRRQSE